MPRLLLSQILFMLVLLGIFLWQGCKKPSAPSDEKEARYTRLREEMVRNQLTHPTDRRPVITDPKVISAMLKVKRHLFVPEELREYAYTDGPLPIGYKQTISQPYMVALMTQCLELTGEEKVLEIGTGSGYQAAVLAEITRHVYTIEILEPLYQNATQTLQKLGYHTVKTKCGDGFDGWEEYAPFDRIIITCAVTRIPEPLLKQLKDGGLIVLPIGQTLDESILSVVRKNNGKLTTQPVIPCRFVPMTGKILEQQKE